MNRDRNKQRTEVVVHPDTTPWFNVHQAAQYMACTLNYVRRLCEGRRIPFAKVGNRYVFRRQDLDAHVESLKQPAVLGVQ